MTGQELLEVLSFVDERYIMEAETTQIRKNTVWTKWVSMAACICILITGVYAYSQMQQKNAAVLEAAAPAVPHAAPEAVLEAAPEEADRAWEEAEPEAAPPMPETEAEAEPIPPYPAEDIIPAGELHHISYARLRVTYIREDGSFDAIVEETDADTNLFENGQQATVIVDPTKVPGADAEVQNDLQFMHKDAQIEIEEGAYDAGMNILYVAQVQFLCRGDH